MPLNVAREISALERKTVAQLRQEYAEVFGYPTRTRNKQWLVKRIAWRLQANEEGDLSERALRRAAELANDADLRLTAPREASVALAHRNGTVTQAVNFNGDHRLPLPGTILKREYKGRTLQVTVLHDGFEFEGVVYRSLSAVSKAITGAHWNGYHFFGLQKKGAK